MAIKLDVTNLVATAEGRTGVPVAVVEGAREKFAAAHAHLVSQQKDGILGFLDLPGNAALIAQSVDFAARSKGRYRDVVVLGIGGSALGPIALRTALKPAGWNAMSDAARGGWPRLHVLDNVDPRTISALLASLELAGTLFMVTSKSGGTGETMAQFLVVQDRLATAGLALRDHVVFVTDPAKGALRAIANREQIPALDVPPNVGGRFSVLAPVGLLPAALSGMDVHQVMAGAGDMAARCATSDLLKNPAGTFAALQWLADTTQGRRIHVLMPYRDSLRDMAAWFVQLWAESLGKVTPSGANVGPTPIPALGATDQHSQVQLFMEGPQDKTVTFLTTTGHEDDVTIPKAYADIEELGYLAGHSLGELLDVEQLATAGALAKRGRPSMTFTLDKVDAWHVGALFMLFGIATVYGGFFYGVNPLDQPGVELGKQYSFAKLGRAGYDAARAEFDALPTSDPRWVL